MRLYPLIFLFLFVLACNNSAKKENGENKTITSEKKQEDAKNEEVNLIEGYTSEIFQTPDLGYGYKIYENGKLVIHQPNIPAVSGNKTFTSSDKAQITADFVIMKLEKGISPPSVTQAELDSLGVL